MKLNFWIVSALAPLTAFMVLAHNTARASQTTPQAPTKRASHIKKNVVLDPPAPATVTKSDVNVRGRASFTGETVGHLQKGDAVTVLAQITLSHPAQDEPAQWAQIALPAGIPVWVNAGLVDADTKTIKARRVNLRGGPGENYSVLGRLRKGDSFREIKSEKGWLAIEAPTNAYAYVAAEFLDMQSAPAVAVTPPPPEAAPAPVPVPAAVPAPEPQIVNVPTAVAPVTASNEPSAAVPVAPAPASSPGDVSLELEALHRATTNEPAPVPSSTLAAAPAVAGGPVIPRIVTREGFVRRAYNIQAPTDFELRAIQNGTLIDYLQPKKGQNFKIFVGTHITVTGREELDRRWPRTPVLQVQSVDLIP